MLVVYIYDVIYKCYMVTFFDFKIKQYPIKI